MLFVRSFCFYFSSVLEFFHKSKAPSRYSGRNVHCTAFEYCKTRWNKCISWQQPETYSPNQFLGSICMEIGNGSVMPKSKQERERKRDRKRKIRAHTHTARTTREEKRKGTFTKWVPIHGNENALLIIKRFMIGFSLLISSSFDSIAKRISFFLSSFSGRTVSAAFFALLSHCLSVAPFSPPRADFGV